MKFRKKPVVIEAELWDGTNVEHILRWISSYTNDFADLPNPEGYVKNGIGHIPGLGILEIPTLEGTMSASAGDWIIRGVQGEFYPCKPDIFEATYEAIDED